MRSDVARGISQHLLSASVLQLLLSASVSQADNQVDNVRQHFYEVSLEYVFKVQEVQERKMFDFVEPVSKRKTDLNLFILSVTTLHSLSMFIFILFGPCLASVTVSDSFSCWRFSKACSPIITMAMSWQRTSTTSRLS